MFVSCLETDRTITICHIDGRGCGKFKPYSPAMTTALMFDVLMFDIGHKTYRSVDPIGLPGGRCLAAIKAASVLAGRDWNRSISRASH